MLKKYAIFGIGNAGCIHVSKLKTSELYDRIAVNTDKTSIEKAIADRKIIVNQTLTSGSGCGGMLELGRFTFFKHEDEFVRIFNNYENVIFICGLGGGMSGFIEAASQILEKKYIFILTKPFAYEGKRRREMAEKVLAELEDCNKIIIEQDKFIKNKGQKSLTSNTLYELIGNSILDNIEKIISSN